MIDTVPGLDAIYEADPAIGEEIRKRFDDTHPAERRGREGLPEVENRLLKDTEKADLVPLLPGGHLAPRHGARSRQTYIVAR